MKIKELYYRFKYRPKKGQRGATGIIFSNNKKAKGDLKKSQTISPVFLRPATKITHLF